MITRVISGIGNGNERMKTNSIQIKVKKAELRLSGNVQ
jgi:hypothetical protein